MKKALIVATRIGFIAAFEKNDIQILQSLGYEVHCACDFDGYGNKEKVDNLLSMGIVQHDIKFTRNPLSKKTIKAYQKLKNIVRQEHFDLVHCHTPVGGVLGRIASRKYHVNTVIYTAHGFHFFDGAPITNWIFYYPIEKILSRWTDVLITINKEDYKRASENFKAKKTVYIPGVGVDTEKYASCQVDVMKKRAELGVQADDFLLLSVGELSERKNQRVVIEALEKMKENNTIENIVYLIVGKGHLQKEYEGLISDYDLNKHVRILGFRKDIDELCKTVDCFVHPSIREGLGIAPLEAMAAGLPLISATANGIKDYTEDGISGYCIDPTNIDALADAITKMHNDEAFRTQCSQNNIQTVKAFDIHKTNDIMMNVYS